MFQLGLLLLKVGLANLFHFDFVIASVMNSE